MSNPTSLNTRVRAEGKFFRQGDRKWYLKGFSYGPFAPNTMGEHLPETDQLRADMMQIRSMGGNCLRLYYPPPLSMLDEALEHGLRLFVDVPWDKHRCFFEDWKAEQEARHRVRETARDLGNHPAVFAISVANEVPTDIVRFYGHPRVERFVNELLDEVKQQAPECLATFVNFPTTEYLTPTAIDFACFNVYLHDSHKLGDYLDRLQHISGDLPLVLGEYGIDTIRNGEDEQARLVTEHVKQVFSHGLAGTTIFSFTDDWYRGGSQIEDWAFGVTRRDRTEKSLAHCLQQSWESPAGSFSSDDLPKVSVVVCSYNGAETLEECLRSLMHLNYPDYEVVLVDDGSTDRTADIAAKFPQVMTIRQPNMGLSVARNVGAKTADGEIVAYTDSDCVVDEDWLMYLVRAMRDQGVEAIGGPNISPMTDGWVSQCVSCSPGNPSHVMLDDRHAEHVPGCNMAFRRDTLLGLDGFDPQFRQAGDDVDICWRIIDAGLRIGYAPGATVWHHRRSTVGAYLKQQKGYGKSEAMVHFKHPQRFSIFGHASWNGVIYGDGAVGLPLRSQLIYHGQFGSALFQTIYRHNEYGVSAWLSSLEWHVAALFMLMLGTMIWQLSFVGILMWLATLIVTLGSAIRADLPRGAPFWCRPLVWALYSMQPVVRGWYRQTHLLRNKRLPKQSPPSNSPSLRKASPTCRDLYWDNPNALGREQLLSDLVCEARSAGWSGDFDDGWSQFDLKLIGDRWHELTIRTASEELGNARRFTRARCSSRPTFFAQAIVGLVVAWSGTAIISEQPWAMGIGLVSAVLAYVRLCASRWSCLSAVTTLVWNASDRTGLSDLRDRGSVDLQQPPDLVLERPHSVKGGDR